MAKRKRFEDKMTENVFGFIFALPFYLIYFFFVLMFILIKYFCKAISVITEAIIQKSRRKKNGSVYQQQYRLRISEDDKELLHEIDIMDGHEFEKFMAEVLKKNGYKNVCRTRGSGDYGADIIAELDGIKYAFQCKRFESKIGPKPIGEVLRGMNHYKCSKGVVITNNYFTNQAQKESVVNNIELWDRDKVLSLCRVEKNETNDKTNNNSEEPIKNNANPINWKVAGIVAGIILYIVIGVGFVCYFGTNYSYDEETSIKTTNASIDNGNKQDNSLNENQISYYDLCKVISEYANSQINSEQLEVVVKKDSDFYSVTVDYILKDKNHSKQECEELLKTEITKIYNMLKEKELIWKTIYGEKDCKNVSIRFSLEYKKKSSGNYEYTQSIGIGVLKYSNDRWKKSYEDIMQKDIINSEYNKMNNNK